MPPYPCALSSCNGQGVWLRGGESSNIIFQTLIFLPLSLVFFFAISLVWLLRLICNGPIMVSWMYLFLFCVTTNADLKLEKPPLVFNEICGRIWVDTF